MELRTVEALYHCLLERKNKNTCWAFFCFSVKPNFLKIFFFVIFSINLDVSACLKSSEHEHEADTQDDDVHLFLGLWTHDEAARDLPQIKLLLLLLFYV